MVSKFFNWYTFWVFFSFLAYVTAVSSKSLNQPPEVFPTSKGNTKLNLVVCHHRARIPLNDPHKGEKLYFEYTGRFYAMKNDDGDLVPLLPGPTLHVVPGGKILLNLTNELGSESNPFMTHTDLKRFHHPNTTNVHFHGMHSNPLIDNPFKVIAPKGSIYYKLRIPRDHMPGLHWYHAHSHGSTYYQLMGGLFGAIVVDEGTFMNSLVHPLRDWDSQILIVHLYRLGPSKTCDGATMQAMDQAMGSNMPSSPRIVNNKGKEHPLPGDLYLVNGQHQPRVRLIKDRPMILRMTYAAGSCHLNVTFPNTCSLYTFAIDGIQLRQTENISSHWVYFTTATRMELIIICHRIGKFPAYLSENKHIVLFSFSVKSSTEAHKKKHVLLPTFPLTMPKYKPNYLYSHSSNITSRDISFSQLDLPSPRPYYTVGQGSNCSSLHNDSTCFYEHFQGSLGSDYKKYHGFLVPLHGVVQLRVFGDPTDPTPHPLHFHVNHFQFISFEPRPGGKHANHTMAMYGIAPGQIRDTIPILDGITTIRWQAATYKGEVVYHCHALHHEDRGMMTSYYIYDSMEASKVALAMQKQVSNSDSKKHWSIFAFVALGMFFIIGVLVAWKFLPSCLNFYQQHLGNLRAQVFGHAASGTPAETTLLLQT